LAQTWTYVSYFGVLWKNLLSAGCTSADLSDRTKWKNQISVTWVNHKVIAIAVQVQPLLHFTFPCEYKHYASLVIKLILAGVISGPTNFIFQNSLIVICEYFKFNSW